MTALIPERKGFQDSWGRQLEVGDRVVVQVYTDYHLRAENRYRKIPTIKGQILRVFPKSKRVTIMEDGETKCRVFHTERVTKIEPGEQGE